MRKVELTDQEWVAIIEMIEAGTEHDNNGCSPPVSRETSDYDRFIMATVAKLRGQTEFEVQPVDLVAEPAPSHLPEAFDPAEAMEALYLEAGKAAILNDLRDRRLLKYLFDPSPDNCMAYGYVEAPLALDVQEEIAETLVKAVVAARAAEGA